MSTKISWNHIKSWNWRKFLFFGLFLFWLVSSQLLFTYTCDVFVKSTSRVPPPLSWEQAGMLSLFFFWWPKRGFLQNYLQFFVKILLGNYFKVWLENWRETWLRNMIIFDTVAISCDFFPWKHYFFFFLFIGISFWKSRNLLFAIFCVTFIIYLVGTIWIFKFLFVYLWCLLHK